MKLGVSLLILLSVTFFVYGNNNAENKKIKEKIIHYYSVKIVDGIPNKDKLKDCFSCNQGLLFDKNGKEIELRFYKADMKSMFGYERYLYDSKGRKIGSEYFDEKGVNTTNYKYEYDALGRRKFNKAYDKKTDKMLYGSEFDYDNQGNQFETATLNKEGNINNYYRREYNIFDLAVLESIVNKEGKVTFKVRYEYIPCGTKDWVDQITYYNGKLSEIRNKEVKYYEADNKKISF